MTGEGALPDLRYGRLGRNVGFSTVSFGLRVGVNVILIVLAARVLSTQGFGQYTLAISLGSIFVVLCDYGFNFLVTREVARNAAAAGEFLPNGALAKAVLSLAALLLLGATLDVLGASRTVVAASVIIMLSFLANSYGSYLTAAFKGLQRFDYETLSNVILYAVLLAAQGAVLWLAASPVNLALCFLFARLVYLGVCVTLYRRVVRVGWQRPSLGRSWQMLAQASPFALYAFSAVLSVQLGTVILSYFAGETAVGQFQQALRFGMAATIPLAIAEDVFYAFLSDVRARAPDQFARGVVRLNKVGAAVIVPLTLASLLYGQELVRAAYGARTGAVVGESLMVVMGAYFCLYFLFLSPPLMAMGLERANLIIWGVGAGINVVANLLLIPAWGVLGASWALFITYAAMKLLFLAGTWRYQLRIADWDLFVRCVVPQVGACIILRALAVPAPVGLTLLGAMAVVLGWSLAPRRLWAEALSSVGQ